MAEDSYIPDARQIQILDWLFGGGSLSIPATYDLSLWDGVPGDGGTELSGDGYARIARTNDGALFAPAGSGTKVSASALRWPATGEATGEWTYNYAALTAVGSGTVLHRLLATEGTGATVPSGEALDVPAGRLELRYDAIAGPWMDDYFAQIWDALYGGGTYAPPAEVAFALFTDDPRAGGVEASGGGYARVVAANTSALWSTGALVKETVAALPWPGSGAFSAALGRLSHVVVYDHDTGEPMLVIPRTRGAAYTAAGDVVELAAGEISFGFVQDM